MSLREYRRKRDFTRTAEPRGKRASSKRRLYVIQKHAASRLHYDFRLEHDGALLSWAVPKGPSLDPADKRLAVRVEDHPVDYGAFEGIIPKGQYGGGSVLLWDRGTWTPDGDVAAGLKHGKLDFVLHGKKLSGGWKLIRLRARNGEPDDKNWLLVKRSDDEARPGATPITDERPESVKSGKEIEQIGSGRSAVHHSNRGTTVSSRNGGGSRSRNSGSAKKKSTAAARKTTAVRSRAASASKRTRKTSALRVRAVPPATLAAKLDGARRAALPGFVPVQLATLVDTAPESDGWIHEVKFDGYRMLAQLDGGKVRWFSRNGLDWSARFAQLSPAILALPARRALIDGEVVVLDEGGVSHFQRLQGALSEPGSETLSYFAFDLLHVDGYDLRDCRLIDRKRVLQALLADSDAAGALRFSEHVENSGETFLRAACEHALEGIVSKRAEGRYLAGRSREWTKAKCGQRQEFVVVGFTKPKGARTGLGALALAVREKNRWRFAGRVGTGFDARTLTELRTRLEKLRTADPPFDEPLSAENRRGVEWVEPRIVVEVAFACWTSDGLVRHASFEGLREDKSVRSVVREDAPSAERGSHCKPVAARRSIAKRVTRPVAHKVAKVSKPRPKVSTPRPSKAKRAEPSDDSATVAGIVITHPERVLDVASGVTKLEVARYYERVAPLVLPHLAQRPLSVIRCPSGFAGTCFFQKHDAGTFGDAVKSIALRDSGGNARYLSVDSVEGLIALVQMNVIELHPWGSRADRLEHPDRMYFDLDPDPGVAWERVIEAALTVRDVLAGMRIESFAKTTGGKGLHVVVPLARKYTWAEVKEFARAIAFELARADPKHYVAIASKTARRGRIFIDYLRNGRGATAVAPYSLRARAGAPLSMPIAWNSLERLASGAAFQLEHGSAWKPPRGRDPWAGFLRSEQTLPRASTKPAAAPRKRAR